jgi:hypothetical protein
MYTMLQKTYLVHHQMWHNPSQRIRRLLTPTSTPTPTGRLIADRRDISLTGSNMALVVGTDSKLEEEDIADEGRVKGKDSVEGLRQRTRGRMGKLLRHRHNVHLPPSTCSVCPLLWIGFAFGLVLFATSVPSPFLML